MIEVIDIHKRFGKEEVLKGINFQIQHGARTCIVGPSGTGKSVLLKIMLGLLHSDRGEVIFDDQQTALFTQQDWNHLMEKIGLVFQGAALFDSLPIWENVGMRFLEAREKSESEIRKQVAEALASVKLASHVMEKFPAELSGGMRKRVGIARAIIHQPAYLFFDEPTTGLDPLSAAAVDELILALSARQEQTFVIVTHDLYTVRKIADQVVMLQGGKVIFDGGKGTFFESDQVEVQAFLQRMKTS